MGGGSPQWLGETGTVPGQERVRLWVAAADREFILAGAAEICWPLSSRSLLPGLWLRLGLLLQFRLWLRLRLRLRLWLWLHLYLQVSLQLLCLTQSGRWVNPVL